MAALDYTSVDEIRKEFVQQLSTGEYPALGKVVTWVSRSIDRTCQRRFYTTTGDEIKTFDGPPNSYGMPSVRAYSWGSRTFSPGVDLVSVTTLELAQDSVTASSGTYATIAAADFVLQPSYRPDGYPAQWLEVIDTPSGTYNSSAPFTYFNWGLRTVRITGKFGWNATSVESTNFPQEIRMVAIELTTKLWRSREVGYGGTLGLSEIGTAIVSRNLSPWARDVLAAYTRPVPY